MIISALVAKQAAEHLRRHDAVLATAIAKYGLCTIRPHHNYYQALVDSIISQQLSVKAAAAIEQRFRDMFGGEFPRPEQILTKNLDELRAIGLSYAKGKYVQDLAQHVLDGKVQFDQLDQLSNDQVMAELTAVKGIGEWTAHMFLMFCMGRCDILPVGDLGIRNSIRRLYDMEHAPSPDEIRDLADRNHWHPYQSIASWYIWKSLDNTPNVT